MLAIISSAKTMDLATKLSSKAFSGPIFRKEANSLGQQLKALTVSELAKLLKISPKLAALNYSRFQHFSSGPAKSHVPALAAYRGDVYMAINAGAFSAADVAFAQNHLRIISGLYGLLSPLDLIQEYRLEMSTPLRGAKFRSLYDFWGVKITKQLREQLAAQKSSFLVNLASEEYSKVVLPEELGFPILDVSFKQQQGTGFKNVGILAKQARGLMVNYMVRERVDRPEGLKEFDCEGYRYNTKLSSELAYCFTRKWK
jgi:cytoplasmic iron level regulating protein YaaA (DUF328/UPF0246 family)